MRPLLSALCSICIPPSAIMLIALYIYGRRAPVGYEDAAGWHPGEPTRRGSHAH